MPDDPTTRRPFHVTVFGGPQFFIRGETCKISPLQGNLLGLLYGRDTTLLSREEVLSVFWPEDAPTAARRRLNQLVYSLKKRTGEPPPFDSEGEEIRQTPDRVSSDLQSFTSALNECRFADCMTHVSRGFLRHSEGSFTGEFSDWIRDRDQGLRRLLRNKTRRWLAASEEKADWEAAQNAAEVLLNLDPTNEETLRLLLRTRARAGGYLDFESTLREFSGRMEETAGAPWEPSDETQSLVERFRLEGTFPQSTWTLKGAPTVREPPLFGRESEHKLLRRTLATPPHHALRGIMITGEAGIGKTRLIRESLLGLGMEGQSVFSADSAELERIIPLNPLIEAFSGPRAGEVLSQLEDPWRAVLYGVMPRHFKGVGPVPQAPPIQPGSVPRRLFEAFHQLVLSLVDDEPVLLVIEDLQWADETTLAVLDFLVRRWDQGRFQILFSVRSEEINRNSVLRSFLDTLRVHEDFLEIPLGDLTPTASTTLIQELSDRPFQGDEVTYLQALAGGNPFFLIELTLEYLAGRVDQPVLPVAVISIPLSIKQVLQRRLSRLSPEADQVLGALSVHARALKIEDLASLVGITTQDCIASLDQLHQFRLVEGRGVSIVICHELIRQTVYQELSASRRAWLHERVARYLQESVDPPPADDLAVHFHMAGSDDEAREYSRKAAGHAEESGAVAEALQFLQIAREHSEDPEEVAELIGRMGHLHYLHQNLEEAAPLLEVAAQRFRRQGKNSKALAPELERVDALGQSGRLPLRDCLDELVRIKQEAKELEEWGTYTKVLDVELHFFDHSGNLDGVRRTIAEAEHIADRGEAEARCRARSILAMNLYFGDPKIGLTAARGAVKIAMDTDNKDLQLHALNRLIVVLLYQGRLNSKEGTTVLGAAEDRFASSGDLIIKFFIKLNRAVWHLEAGELDLATTAFPMAESVLRGTRAKHPHLRLLLNRAELEFALEDVTSARQSYSMAKELLGKSSPSTFRTVLTAGLGLCALHEGQLSEAKQLESELLTLPSHWTFDPSVVGWFKAEMFRMRGDPGGAERFLGEVAKDVKGRFVTAWIKLNIRRAQFLRRSSREAAEKIARETSEVTEKLGLRIRSQEIERAVPSLRDSIQ